MLLYMQGLPLLSQLYPSHWLLKDHPAADAMDDPTSDSDMHKWIRFARKVHSGAVAAEDEHTGAGLAGAPQWSPSASLRREGNAIEVTWLSDLKVPEASRDPAAAFARKKNLQASAGVESLLGSSCMHKLGCKA